MWLAIKSLRDNNSDAIVSAGNTGALFVIAKLNLKMIENIDKPALSALWPKEKPFPSLYGSIIKYIKSNTENEVLKKLKFNKKQTIKYVLRALPNEISGGIATSLIFSAWNAAVYVNQISDEQIMNAERKKYYQKVVKDIVNKNKGLYFNNELFVIEKK